MKLLLLELKLSSINITLLNNLIIDVKLDKIIKSEI